MVKVKFFATLINFTGKKQMELTGINNVKELLDKLEDVFPGFKKEIEQGFLILVNGRNIEHLQTLETPLEETDTISIFPPLGGG